MCIRLHRASHRISSLPNREHPEGLDPKFFTRHMTGKTRHLRLCYYHVKYVFFVFFSVTTKYRIPLGIGLKIEFTAAVLLPGMEEEKTGVLIFTQSLIPRGTRHLSVTGKHAQMTGFSRLVTGFSHYGSSTLTQGNRTIYSCSGRTLGSPVDFFFFTSSCPHVSVFFHVRR